MKKTSFLFFYELLEKIMRIISGHFKGRKLTSFNNPKIRPMTDRIKESVFNTLKPWFKNKPLVLDLFSGTGNIALEALSWNAREVHAVEFHKKAIQIIKKNKEEILDNKKSLIIHERDVFSFIRSFKEKPFNIIIADPPFSSKLGDSVLEAISKSHLYILSTIFVIEVSKHENLKDTYDHFKLFSKKDFCDKKVLFYECKKCE